MSTLLYEILLKKSKDERKANLKKQIEKLNKEIENLNNGIELIDKDLIEKEEFALLDRDDRIKIINDMENDFKKKSFNKHTSNILALFHHVDNVRFVYEFEGLECPKWYRDKYSSNFNK